MSEINQANPALATDTSTGLTHMVWNENGQIYSAYFDPVCKCWEDAVALPGSTTGRNLQINTNVAIRGANGQVTPGLLATWTAGTGNQAEVYDAVGVRTPLGNWEWSRPLQLTHDVFNDEHAQVTVRPDGQLLLVTQKSDADDPEATPVLHSQTFTVDHRDLVFGGTPTPSFVVGSNLPVFGGGLHNENFPDLPPDTFIVNYNFDLGLKFSNDSLPLLGKLPLVGGKQTKIELDLRLRGGFQEHDPELTGFGSYAKVGLLRGEIKLSVKIFDIITIAGYVQGLFVFGGQAGNPSNPTVFLGGRLTEGLQAKVEYAPPSTSLFVGSGNDKVGGAFGVVFDVRIQQNNVWAPALADPPETEPPEIDITDFANLVRADGSAAQVGDNPAQLRWKVDLSQLASLILGSLGASPKEKSISADPAESPTGAQADSAAADAALDVPLKYSSQFQLSPGIGAFGKIVLTSFFEGKMSLIIYVDFLKTDTKPFGYSNARARLDAEARFGVVTLRYRQEWSFGKVSEDAEPGAAAEPVRYAYDSVSYAPRAGGGGLANEPGAIFGGEAADVPFSMAMGADGTLVMAWVQDAPNDSGDFSYIAVSQSTNGGTSWSTPSIVPGSAGLNVDPVVSFDSAGRAVVAWNNGDASALASQPPGHAYVVFGSNTLGGVGNLDLGALDGKNGFAVAGGALLSAIGGAVSGAGDLNKDGTQDAVIGAPDAAVDSGKAYVLLGKTGIGSSGQVDVASLNGTNGFAIEGLPYSQLGTSVHRAGDVNGDGIDDLIVGAPGAGSGATSGAGAAYVILGSTTGFGSGGVVKVSDLNGKNGFSLTTGVRLDAVGTTVSGGVDVNGDGRADLVIGAPGVNGGAGAYYVVFGKSGLGDTGTVDLSTLNGTNGYSIVWNPGSPKAQGTTVPLGAEAALTADLNGDGIGDLVLASDGQAFVVFGDKGLGATGTLDLFQPGAAKVLTIDGREENGFAALSVSDAGDVNGDGYRDLIVGTPATVVDDETRAGRSFVIYGNPALKDRGTILLQDLNGTNGFKIDGAGDAVSGAEDLNKDGFADLLIGDPSASVGDKETAGKSYLVFGSATLGAGGEIKLSTLPAGQVLQLDGAGADDASGAAVSGVGDVNGDGIADLIVGAPQTINMDDFEEAIAGSHEKYSVLNGQTWSNAADIPGVPAGAKGASSLQKLPDGRLLLTWLSADPADDTKQRLQGAFWNGSAWASPMTIATGHISNTDPPRISQVSGQTMIIWSEILPDPNNINNDQFQLYSSTLMGGSWTAPAALGIAPAVVQPQSFAHNLQLSLPQAGGGTSVLTVANAAITEEGGWIDVVVRRSGDLSQALTVNFATHDGSATAGSDYEAREGTVAFAAGESERAVRIQVSDDAVAERRNETIQLRLWSADDEAYLSHGNLRLDQPAEILATITIMDNEPTQLAAIGSGFVIKTDPAAGVGQAVIGAGDLNKDGYDDFVIGAPGKGAGAGRAYVVYGSANIGTDGAGLNLDDLNGKNGASLTGLVPKGQAGIALTAADFDRDGYSDLAIGNPQNINDANSGPGRVYVVHGNAIAGKAGLDLNSTNAKELVTTTNYSLAGAALATGDVNKDGVADLVIGAPGINKVFVVFGQALSGTGTINLETMTSAQGFVLTNGVGLAGRSVAVADLDGDGVKDILVGAPNASPVAPAGDKNDVRGFGGQVYAVFGNQNIGKNGPIDLAGLNGANGMVLKGQAFINASDAEVNPDFAFADSAGASVSSAGDINGDGKEDVLIGAPQLAPNGVPGVGGAYVLFGGNSWKGAGASFQLASVNGSNGFVAAGVPGGSASAGGTAGSAVSAAGDLNGDKIDDLMVGVPTLNTQGDNTNTGQAGVLFGTRNWIPFLDGNSLDLSDIPSDSRVFAYNGTVLGGNASVSVSGAGDINKDGLPDLVIGAPTAGEAYVAFGRAWMGPGGSMDVSKLRSDNGFVFTPPSASEIAAVQSGGDLNGDGYLDLLIADGAAGGGASQRINVVFGSDPKVGGTPLAPLVIRTSELGFVAGSQSVGHGDFNGDGLADLIIGTTSTTSSRFATIVFGNADNKLWSADSGAVTLSALQQQHGGVSIDNSDFTSKKLTSVASVDINGDGYDDLVVSSADSNPFVLFGQAGWTTGKVSTVSVPSALDGKTGFVLRSNSNANSLTNINDLGDVNGDGYQDLGVVSQDSQGGTIGYVVYGKANIGSGGRVNLDTLDGTNGFRLQEQTTGFSQRTITSAGDVNGDGFDDFIVAETRASMQTAHYGTYIVFGRPQLGAGGTVNLNSLTPTQGFTLTTNVPQTLGYSVSAAGDVNGDGYADLLIGAPSVNDLTRGESYVVYGNRSIGASGSVSVDGLSGNRGFAAVGAQNNSYSGSSVAGPGDLNGDGFADLAIGARGTTGPGGTPVPGRTYAAFGGDFTGSTNFLGTAGDDVLQATVKATTANPVIMNGGQGNDILESAGNEPTSPDAVVMIGGDGNDILTVGSLAFRAIDGGSGNDTLVLNPYLLSSNNLDLTNPNIGNRIHGIENIELGCQNRVTLRLVDLLELSDTTRTWTINGTESRVVVPRDEAWVKAADPVVKDGITYDSWSYKGATILLQQGNLFLKSQLSEAENGATFKVTNTNDSGAGSLRQAILDAAASAGRDTIDLSPIGTGTIKLESVLPTLGIGNDIDFKGSLLGSATISGQGKTHLFNVDGANVSFIDINFTQGLAKGGNGANGGGGGLGAGSALTIQRGSVDLVATDFSFNTVAGGSSSNRAGGGGNGGIATGRDSSSGGTGGDGGGFEGGTGAKGGAGGARNDTHGNPGEAGKSGGFGIGGGAGGGGAGGESFAFGSRYSGSSGRWGGAGGFGAGGAGGGGGGGGGSDGVFGRPVGTPMPRGGGGSEGSTGGGFAGSGEAGVGGGNERDGGAGGTGGGGSGLGGAIFVNAGAKLNVTDTRFGNNGATGGSGGKAGQGKGGAIFAREGSIVTGAQLIFDNNKAANAATDKFSGYGKHQDDNDVYGTISAHNPYPGAITGTVGDDTSYGTDHADYVDGATGNDTIWGLEGDDLLVGGGGQDVFLFRPGDGNDTVAEFTSLTRSPSDERAAEGDVLKFEGAGLTVRNLLLTRQGGDTEVSFEGVPDLRVTLNYAAAETLANLGPTQGNILFDGESTFQDSYDVIPEGMSINDVLRPGVVTFLDDGDNLVCGSDDDDVINGGAGIDDLTGGAGDDILRGGVGDDRLGGGDGHDGDLGNDRLDGGDGDDVLRGGAGDDVLDGGTGFNTAIFTGPRTSYAFTQIGASIIVAGPDGTDTLTNIQQLRFSDGTLPVTAVLGSRSTSEAPTPVETYGATVLVDTGTQVLLLDSSANGPSLTFMGAEFAVDLLGGYWKPIGAEKAADGYQVAWQSGDGSLFSVWNTDSNGRFLGEEFDTFPGWVGGTALELKALESSFQQDLNGDQAVGVVEDAHTFVFDEILSANDAARTIAGFDPAQDSLVLDHAAFPGLPVGRLGAEHFATGSASGPDPQIVYDALNGALFYDANGAAAGGATQVATLSNRPSLAASNIFIS